MRNASNKKLDSCVTVFALFLGACATITSAPLPKAALQLDTVSEIVTGGIRQARVEFTDGCLYLQTAKWRYVAFFPQGTVLDDIGNSLILPNGKRIVIGKSYPLLLEYYPTLKNANIACDGPNAIVRDLPPAGSLDLM